MTALSNGQLLVAGGRCGTSESTGESELYDPTAKKWSATSNLNDARGYSVAVRLADGLVLVAGGLFINGVVGVTTEIYTPA